MSSAGSDITANTEWTERAPGIFFFWHIDLFPFFIERLTSCFLCNIDELKILFKHGTRSLEMLICVCCHITVHLRGQWHQWPAGGPVCGLERELCHRQPLQHQRWVHVVNVSVNGCWCTWVNLLLKIQNTYKAFLSYLFKKNLHNNHFNSAAATKTFVIYIIIWVL